VWRGLSSQHIEAKYLNKAGTWVRVHSLLLIPVMLSAIIVSMTTAMSLGPLFLELRTKGCGPQAQQIVEKFITSSIAIALNSKLAFIAATGVWGIIAAIPLSYLSRSVRRRRSTIIAVVVLGVVGAIIAAALYPSAYSTAVATVKAKIPTISTTICSFLEKAATGRVTVQEAQKFSKALAEAFKPVAQGSAVLAPGGIIAALAVIALAASYMAFGSDTGVGRLKVLGGILIVLGILLALSFTPIPVAGILQLVALIVAIIAIIYGWMTGTALKKASTSIIEASQAEGRQ